jgi:hypothetical protein
VSFIRPLAITIIAAVTACTQLSKQQCEEGEWLTIGQRDGFRGRDASFVERHVQSCGKHDIAVDVALWEQGRQQGLRSFCTPESQYQAGRDGRPFNEICAAENLPVHREAHEKGRKYFLLTQRIERLRAKIHDLERRSVWGPTDPDVPGANLQFEAFMLRMDIEILRRERRQYESL